MGGGGGDGLQTRTTTAVELHAGDGVAEAGVEGDDAAQGGSSTRGGRLAEDDVVDVLRGDAGAFDDRLDDGGRQILDGDAGEYAAVGADRGAQRGAQDDVRVGGGGNAGVGYRGAFLVGDQWVSA
ncbi:hypothetical protein CVA01_20100 [Corynebacterium variabile]|uniref:Uncharacterized protein n=1 Tax=Corynebacterium variabile TaxID=1727 RepID=A0A4Y4C3J2_9CORY|nr:hypothetical protein CVA01_20100 [Corynebacterium variabile]